MWLLLFNSALCSTSIPTSHFSNATAGLLFSSNPCFLLTPYRPQVFYWPLFKTNNVCCLQHLCELPQMLKLQNKCYSKIIVAGALENDLQCQSSWVFSSACDSEHQSWDLHSYYVVSTPKNMRGGFVNCSSSHVLFVISVMYDLRPCFYLQSLWPQISEGNKHATNNFLMVNNIRVIVRLYFSSIKHWMCAEQRSWTLL